MRRLLITGVPGTGKTTIGEHLARQHSFAHLDFELPEHIQRFLLAGEAGLVEELERVEHENRDVVITWGFAPEADLPLVLALRDRGYEWFWLDGDRAAARRAFVARGTSSITAGELQLRAIEDHFDLERWRPRVVDPFTPAGEFRPFEELANELLGPIP